MLACPNNPKHAEIPARVVSYPQLMGGGQEQEVVGISKVVGWFCNPSIRRVEDIHSTSFEACIDAM